MAARTDPFAALLIGDSLPMRLLYGLMETAAKTSVTVLLEGETGTGKELVARGIHQASDRVKRPFVPLNCAALPETLLESMLFGHKKGAFTGADTDQKGAFQTANTGTMLLDEIGDMPIGIQAKLLRVLQDGEVVPVGEHKPEKVDVRIIASTNRKLLQDLGQSFRADLYYRLAVLSIPVPPLRERVPDIAALAGLFSQRYAEQFGRKKVNPLGGEALRALMAYPWPGNVRELENEIQRAVAVAGDGVMICKEQLAEHIREVAVASVPNIDLIEEAVLSGRSSIDQVIHHVERRLIERAMAQSGGVMTTAAQLLGTTRRRLTYFLLHLSDAAIAEKGLAEAIGDAEWKIITEAVTAAGGNRAKAARSLDLNRTTLVSKIKRYEALHPEQALPKEPPSK